jgi:predicted outer membrane repeat protein
MLTLFSLKLLAADGSLEFDPELAQHVEVPNFASLGIAKEVTVEFWALYTNASISQPVFILNPDVLTNRFQARLNHINGNTYWDFGDSNSGGRVFSSYPTDAVGIWTHFAFVASKSGSFMKIYANGKLAAYANSFNALEDVGSAKFNIGGTLGSYFQGKIDDFRVWNVARTEVEIQRDLSGPLSGSEHGLRLYFKFDESNGSAVAINSAVATGALYNGTIFGNPTFSSPARTIYFVTNTNDSGAGSLRQAFSLSNTEGGPALITFDSSLNGGTITLSSGLSVLTSGGVTVDATNLLTGLTVSGGGGEYSVFSVNYASSVLNLRGLTLTGGKSALFNSGIAKISECILTGNSNTTGGAIYNGGILEMTQCTLSGNSAALEGGAISNTFGRITLTGCTFSGNSSFFSGGAINSKGGTVAIKNSTFTDNSAVNGIGGAIANTIGLTALTHCTVTNNSADVSSGGGIANNGSLELTNCIVTGNTSPRIPDVNGDDATLSGVNFIGDLANSSLSAGAALLTTAQNGAIRLGPLVSNGGSTKTMALLLGSPAIDVATVISGLETDQRNFSRSRDGNAAVGSLPDIGAYELQTAPTAGNINPILVTTSNDELNDSGTLGSGVSLREAVRNAPHGAIITFDPQLNGQTLTLITALGGQIVIEKNLTLDATALPSGVTISGGDSSRIFSVNGYQSFSLRGITLKNGRAISGGALCNDGGTLFLSQCTLSENFSSNLGGAIYNSSMGILTLSQCTLSGNSATFQGGAIFNNGTLTLNHSTIANNHADNGGGIYSGSITDNITLINSIIARNIIIAGFGSDIFNDGTTVTTNGRNLIGDLTDSSLSADPNLLSGDPKLAPTLASNGGPTQTIALLPDSPALGTAVNSTLTTDQRGFPIVGIADIGAYEASITDPSPADTAIDAFAQPTLSWMGPTGAAYAIFLGSTSGSLGSALGTTMTSNFALPTKLAIGTYYWRVDATVEGTIITGTEFSFTVQGVTSTAESGHGSLRQALANAAVHPGPDTIIFHPDLSGSSSPLTSELFINDADGVTIDASTLLGGFTLNGNNATRHLKVAADSSLTLRGIFLTAGNVNGDGGSIYSEGTLILDRCKLSGNRSSTNGGAVDCQGPLFVAVDCTFSNNTAASVGGGIRYRSDRVELTRCTISENNAETGAGLLGSGLFGPLTDLATLFQCTISGNVATGDRSIGGIVTGRGDLNLIHCTISANTGTAGCGGLCIATDSSRVNLTNSIIAGNTSTGGGAADILLSSGTLTPRGANLIGSNQGVETIFPAGPLVGTATAPRDPVLESFNLYGGPTFTMPPRVGSPALDQATVLDPALTTDQRGLPRPLGIRPDLGAVEASIIVVTTPVDELDPPGSPGNGISLREAVGDLPAGGEIDFDRAIFGGATAYTLTLTQGPLNPPRNGFLFNSANPNGIRIGYVATFTQQPQSQNVAQGATASFSVGVMNINGGLAYDWRKNGFGETITPSLSISNAQESNEGVYHVVLSETFSGTSIVPANSVIFPVSITPFAGVSQPASLIVGGAPIGFQRQPAHAMLALGSNHTLSVVAVGPATPALTYQWQRNNVNIAGATRSTHSITNAQLTHAGAYRCLVRSGTTGVQTPSSAAEIGVVDTRLKTVNLAVGGTFTPSVSAAGNGLSYAWFFNGDSLSVTSKLIAPIKPLGPGVSGLYTCVVTGPGGSITTGFNTRLNVSAIAPTLATPLRLPPATIGESYFYQLPVQNIFGAPATSFSVTGVLPTGIVLNTTTGILSGRPTVTRTGGYALSFKAGNTKGFGQPAPATLTVNVVPPTAVGTFAGPIPRSPLNDSLGGRFDLTTTASGLCSGSVTLGARAAIRFTNQLLLSAGTGDVILRANLPGITLADKTVLIAYLEVFAADQRAMLTLVHPTNRSTLQVPGWRNPWFISKTPALNKPATRFAAYYTLRLDPGTGGSVFPSGYGYASFTISTAGALTLAGRLPDGSGVTGGTFVSKDGEILLFNLLYGKRGSHVGQFVIKPISTLVTDNNLDGTTTWSKPPPLTATTTDTVYKDGFGPLTVSALGAAYVPPAKGALVMGLGPVAVGANNARIVFDFGGLPSDFNQLLRIANPSPVGLTNTATVPLFNAALTPNPNPNRVTMTLLNAKTGAISGSFTIPGATPALNRVAPYFGQIIKIGGTPSAYGYFLLPSVPTGTQKVSTSPKLSGAWQLRTP